ncbi:BTB/POZ domain-containing protein [Zavarzinella formosa]|uniref:hypothetical protein n=1 Tax=Zavarzinella formosa TaxID=360055 RepID=UPI0003006AFA|nr:hypothetical protein [Zavarzinella formosa]
MDEFPAEMMARISEQARPVVWRWWDGLTPAEREEAVADWDERREAGFFAPLPGDCWDQIPVVIGGRFVPAEQSQLVGPEWHADYFEYLLSYPELLLNEKRPLRTFGICTAHPEARSALASGCIPAGFVCPLASAECPMRRLLAGSPGQSLCLTGPVMLPKPP